MSKLNAGTIITLSVLAAFATGVPRAAHAGQTESVSRRVDSAGIDLDNPRGAHIVYARLKSAARALCSSRDPVYAASSWVYRECIEDALAKAIRDTHRRLLSEAFVSDYGMQVAAQLGIDSASRVAKK